MKNYLMMLLFMFGIMNFIRENPFRSEDEKININFTREFSYMEEDFYLLNEILSVKDKDKLLIELEESSKDEQQKIFKELLIEKQEEVSKIEEYKKIKFRKEIAKNKKIENTIIGIYESNIFRLIIIIVIFSHTIYTLFKINI